MNTTLVFVIAALVLTALVSSVILWTLLRQRIEPVVTNQAQANAAIYRDQLAELDNEFAQGTLDDTGLAYARDELKRRLLEDTPVSDPVQPRQMQRSVSLAVALAVLFPILGLSTYVALGNPQAMDPQVRHGAASQDGNRPDMSQLADMLAKKLEANPNNAEGWVMLGRTYRSLQRGDEALKAFDKAAALDPDDEIALERVELLADMRGGSFDGEPWRVIQGILKKDAKHYSALLLAGGASFTERKYADALRYWGQARAQLAPGEKDADGLDKAMAQAREQLGQQSPPAKAAKSAPSGNVSAAPSQGTSVAGKVELAAALRDKVSPNDTVFIYATPANGERVPLAIVRTTVGKLPMNFTLDDSTAMNPQRKLSGEAQVTLKARVSKSGNAMTQPGDLTGSLSSVKVGSRDVTLTINEAVK
jgi:cytochrome c-type biogenesis protein CcmH